MTRCNPPVRQHLLVRRILCLSALNATGRRRRTTTRFGANSAVVFGRRGRDTKYSSGSAHARTASEDTLDRATCAETQESRGSRNRRRTLTAGAATGATGPANARSSRGLNGTTPDRTTGPARLAVEREDDEVAERHRSATARRRCSTMTAILTLVRRSLERLVRRLSASRRT